MFRREAPERLCGWQRTGFHVSRGRYARHGSGDTHAVLARGTQSEAVCGQIIRYVGKVPWPPSFGGECPDCARLLASPAGPSGARTEDPPKPRQRPGFAPELFRTDLIGSSTRLEAIRSFHASGLIASADEDRSRFDNVGLPAAHADMAKYIERLESERAAGRRLMFAIHDKEVSRLVGVTGYNNIEWATPADTPGQRPGPAGLEIGDTWISSSARQRFVDFDAYALLLSYAFDRLGVERVSLGADEDDVETRERFLRLGAWFEGLRRGHRVGKDGSLRNSAYYSITCVEWPAIRPLLIGLPDGDSV